MIKFNKIYKPWYLLYILFILTLYVLTLLQILPEFFIHIPLILAFIPISYHALQKLKEKKIGTEFFISLGTIISLIGHQEKAMNVVLIIMLIAEYLEDLISERTQKEIQSLINLIPKNALVKINNEEKIIPISEIKSGMLVIVKTGGHIPVDGFITHGNATINEAALTGESIPVKKKMFLNKFMQELLLSPAVLLLKQKRLEKILFLAK